MYNRANHFRMVNEFDKAISAYEKILDQDDSNAEAHWGIVLSRYGIEYVEDPKTHERIPTCHRVQLTSILSDPDYQAALEHADMIAKSEYKAQAERIAKIQKGILAISSKEAPYDVFICYKESDDSGKRTVDSTLAQDIYYGLTDAGYRVFFSRITLEDKLGQEYEPYIFAALNSAKVMVVVGTKPEYFSAVWVKNEWSRYLDLMKNDHSRLLIPCYRDMDPYDLPDELSMLQSQDMSKIGFMQDLIRGIEKVIPKDKKGEEASVSKSLQAEAPTTYSSNAAALLKRGYMALEDGEWTKADAFFEDALNLDAENGEAYFGKLLASEQLSNLEQYFEKLRKDFRSSSTEVLTACPADERYVAGAVSKYALSPYLEASTVEKLYDFNRTYTSHRADWAVQKQKYLGYARQEKLLIRARKFAREPFAGKLKSALKEMEEYFDAKAAEARREDEKDTERLRKAYQSHLQEADRKAEELYRKAEEKLGQDYEEQVRIAETSDDINEVRKAQGFFREHESYKDCANLVEECHKRIEKLQVLQEEIVRENQEKWERKRQEDLLAQAKSKKRKTRIGILSAVAVAAAIFVGVYVVPSIRYKKADSLYQKGDYKSAAELFQAIMIKDGSKRYADAVNMEAADLTNSGEHEEALNLLENLEDEGYQMSHEIYQKAFDGVKAQYREKGDQCLKEGDPYMAAVNYIRAGDSALAKRTKDLSSLVYAGLYSSAGIMKDTDQNNAADQTSKDGDIYIPGTYSYDQDYYAHTCTVKLKVDKTKILDCSIIFDDSSLNEDEKAALKKLSKEVVEKNGTDISILDYSSSNVIISEISAALEGVAMCKQKARNGGKDQKNLVVYQSDCDSYYSPDKSFWSIRSFFHPSTNNSGWFTHDYIKGYDYLYGIDSYGQLIVSHPNLYDAQAMLYDNVVSIVENPHNFEPDSILLLRSDGSVVYIANEEGADTPDMSDWTDIEEICQWDTSYGSGGYDIGLDKDGKLHMVPYGDPDDIGISKQKLDSLPAVRKVIPYEQDLFLISEDGKVISLMEKYDLSKKLEKEENVADIQIYYYGIIYVLYQDGRVKPFFYTETDSDSSETEEKETESEENKTLRNELASWKRIVSITAYDDGLIGIRYDGKTECCGEEDLSFAEQVRGWGDIVAVDTIVVGLPFSDSSWRYALGIRADGTVVSTGNGEYYTVENSYGDDYHEEEHTDGTYQDVSKWDLW